MLSDSIFEAIDDILKAVATYKDYSPLYKRRIVLSLAHLYLVLWSLDRLHGDMTTTFHEAKRHAGVQFDRAINNELSDLD